MQCAPLRLVLGIHLALGVVANVADLGEAANVQLGCTELRHGGGGCVRLVVAQSR